MSTNCCPTPAATPYPYAGNCEVTVARYCSDGSGSLPKTVPAGYLWVLIADYSSEEAAQIAVNAFAERLARRRALQEVLYCNTLTSSDLADCGLVEERPSFTPGCAFLLCTNSGNTLCTDENIPIAVT